MTASEMRNRLDHRFRLLVGSRQGLERHHTLRHAVAWSYDLLDDAEKALLERCSVFTGGFDLESACAVADSVTTSTAYWICRTHRCASRCWSPTVSGANPVFDAGDDPPIAEERLVVRGEASEIRAAHPRYFAGREADILACGTATGGARPTPGSPPNWPGFRCCPLRQWYEHDHRQRVDCRNPHQPSRLLNDADSRSPAEHRRHVTRPRPASPASADRAQRSRRLAEVSTDGVNCDVGAARMSRQTSHHDPGKPCSSGGSGAGPVMPGVARVTEGVFGATD